MLPFLRHKKNNAGLIVKQRSPDVSSGDEAEGSAPDGMEAAAQDLMDAISAGDAGKVASALRAAFQIADSEPHEEGEHTNDFDSQNEKAAD